ncbi:MAG: Crp/Fnr family transcriptional regulator [Candidatus Goldiibacteriota bacterium]
MTQKEIVDFLQKSYLFSEVSKKGLLMIVKYVRENHYKKGEIIFNEGDTGDSLHIITGGKVKIIKYSKEGKTKTLAVLKEKDSFGEMAVLTKEARSATVEVLEKAETLSITKSDFEYIIRKEPVISLQIIKTLSERLAKADREIKILALGDAKTKVAYVIRDFEKDFEKARFTHQEIAELAGLTRETTTRVLKQMEKDGIIGVEKRKIKIINMNYLKKLCM